MMKSSPQRDLYTDLIRSRYQQLARLVTLRTPEGFDEAIDLLGQSDEISSRLTGPLYAVQCCREYAPGERSVLATPPFGRLFQLDYVLVPEDVAFDPDTQEARLFFHHDQIRPDVWRPGCGKKMPASLLLCQESVKVQRLDLYRREAAKVYLPGEVFTVGTFENVSSKIVWVRAVVVGRTDSENPDAVEGGKTPL